MLGLTLKIALELEEASDEDVDGLPCDLDKLTGFFCEDWSGRLYSTARPLPLSLRGCC